MVAVRPSTAAAWSRRSAVGKSATARSIAVADSSWDTGRGLHERRWHPSSRVNSSAYVGSATRKSVMYDIEPQTADGKVLWHFGMSLDGYVAGPGHAMDWMAGFSNRPSLIEEYVETTGAVLAGTGQLRQRDRRRAPLRRRVAGRGLRAHP